MSQKASSKYLLFHSIKHGNVDELLEFLKENPDFDVSDMFNSKAALHVVCYYGHEEMVRYLLTRPDINVNQQKSDGSTPLHTACYAGRVGVVKALLEDPRVNVNMVNEIKKTALFKAARYGHLEVIKWIIALRGDDTLDIETKGLHQGKGYFTPIGIAMLWKHPQIVSLLKKFRENRLQTRNDVRGELGLFDEKAAEIFATIVFLCDGYLVVSETASPETRRYFEMAQALPMEIQMNLSNLTLGSTKGNIPTRMAEPAFNKIAKEFEERYSVMNE